MTHKVLVREDGENMLSQEDFARKRNAENRAFPIAIDLYPSFEDMLSIGGKESCLFSTNSDE